MAGVIDLQPQVLDLALYAGDGFSFKLVCTDAENAPIDMGGTVKAEIRVDRTTPDNPPVVTFTVGLTDAYLGILTLSLTGAQTQALMDDASVKAGKFAGVWDLEWTPSGSQPRTICQGKVECVADVTQ